MDERQSILRNPRGQAILVSIIVVVIYFFLLGRQGTARNVILDGDYAYVSVGKYGGVRVVDVTNPKTPREVGYYDTTGDDNRTAIAGNYLYVADGKKGMRVIDVSDHTNPKAVGSIILPDSVLGVTAHAQYAYLAAGKLGLVIADVSNPTRPEVVSIYDTPGSAENVVVNESIVYTLNQNIQITQTQTASQTISTFAYVADGDKGILILDVNNPSTPMVVGQLALTGEAHTLVVANNYAYVACGSAGLQIADVTLPTHPFVVGSLDTNGDAQDVAVANNYAYVANGNQGVSVIDVFEPFAPREVGTIDSTGPTQGLAVAGAYVYSAGGRQGVSIVDISNPLTPVAIGLYESPGEATPWQIFQAIYQRGRLPYKVIKTLVLMLFDLVLIAFCTAFGVIFFAQFVLPVHTLRERRRAVDRLTTYLMGGHGPAIFIENGEVREGPVEKMRFGPGVALLDTASAAVFRRASSFTRPAGPGIIFTNIGEYLAGQVDLHRQTQHLGPRKEEDPFSPHQEGELKESYDERQKRRYATSALTRDGVELVPNISTSFKLDSQPSEGGTRFGYSPEAVWRAIAGEGIRADAPPDSQERYVPWDWLPVYLAADLWREYLRKFTLDELFAYTTGPSEELSPLRRKTAFDTILDMVRDRMRQEEVDELDETGHPTGRKVHSKEYEQLKQRGIRMLSVSIRNLHFPPTVEDQLVEQWKATWLDRAQNESKEADRLQSYEKVVGENEALRDYGLGASLLMAANLRSSKKPKHPDLPESLELLVRGTLEQCLRDPDLRNRMTNEKRDLADLIEWIRKNKDGSTSSAG